MTGTTSLTARRAEIAEAVLRIVARDGLDAVSMRTVATEARRSLGWVQREFASKDLLLQQTLIHAIDLMGRRIADRAERQGNHASIRDALGAMTEEVLPGRAETVAEERVWLAFMARAALEPDLAEPLRAHYRRSHEAIAEAITIAQSLGQAAPELDIARESHALVALTDGLTAHVLVGILPIEHAIAILDAHLDRLLRRAAPAEQIPD